MIDDPPSDPGLKATASEPSPAVTDEMVGAAAVDDVGQLEVITRFPVPLLATATNFSCPAGPPQVTESQLLSAADVCVIHVVPSLAHEVVDSTGFAVVKTQLANSPRPAAATTRRSAAKFIVHRFPSGGPDNCFA